MRTWIQRGCLVAMGAALVGTLLRPASGEGEPAGPARFESVPMLYATTELGLGGRPLYQALFPSGWPTTKDYRHLTLDVGEGAFVDNVSALLGSGLGVPLTVSSGERQRVEDLQKTDPKMSSVGALLRDRFEQFRQISGLAQPVDDKFAPIFLPYRRGEPVIASFDEGRPSSWSWSSKTTEATISLDAVGLAIYSQTLLAEQQLAIERKVDTGSGAQSYLGRGDIEGFTGLCGLACSVAAMNELRNKLCIDLKIPDKPQLGPYPKLYDPTGEYARRTYYPHLITPSVTAATVSYAVPTSAAARESHLFDQAALLLGVSELARASDLKGPLARFFANDKKGFFDPATSSQATDLAVFLVECLYSLHCNPQGKLSSFATIERWGDLVRTEDAGMILVALDQFLRLDAQKSPGLQKAQQRARGLVEKVAAFLCTVQQTSKVSPGFCDAFNLATESGTDDKASLAAQGLAIRGLIAAKHAFAAPTFGASAAARPDVLAAAQKAMRFLEKSRWDGERRAYVDTPGTKDKVKVRAFDAFAVLGGLRDLALDTKDVRYLLRYKSYLTTLRANGIQVSATAREGDGSDGLKKAAAVGLAPVTATEITLP